MRGERGERPREQEADESREGKRKRDEHRGGRERGKRRVGRRMRAEREDKQRTWEQHNQKGGGQGKGREGRGPLPGYPSPSQGFTAKDWPACDPSEPSHHPRGTEQRQALPDPWSWSATLGFMGCAWAERCLPLCPPDERPLHCSPRWGPVLLSIRSLHHQVSFCKGSTLHAGLPSVCSKARGDP